MPESNDRDRVSFENVGKLAKTPKTPAGPIEERSENSGLINLTAMIAGEGKPPPMVGELPVQPAPTPAPAQTPAAPEQARRDGRVWMALATGVVLGLLAAGVAFAMRGAAANSADPAAASASRPPLDRANTGAPATRAVSDDLAVDPSTLPAANGTPATPIGPIAGASNTTSNHEPTLVPQTTPSPPSAQTKVKTSGAPAGSPSETSAGESADETLEGFMKRAVGPGTQTVPATAAHVAESPQPAGEGLPAKPALGAVQGAIGTVLPGARSCLGPDDPVSRATITFKSDGSVQAVAVSGHASGEPAEECIRSRLMAARIPPFANPTFTWTVTVRPAA